MKDLRPFGFHTQIKELDPLFNDEVFAQEISKVQ